MHTRRRPRGSLVEPRRVTLTLEAQADEALVREAEQLGVTKSALAQWLIETIPRDEHGVPAGWTEAHRRDEELPLDSA